MRIILADHHTVPLYALKELLKDHPEFELIGEAMDGESLIFLASEHPADLVLIDSDLPGIRMEDLFPRLHTLTPRPIVVVMCGKFEKSKALLQAGADAFVSKSEHQQWILETLQEYERRITRKQKI